MPKTRTQYLTNELIQAIENQLTRIDGVKRLLGKLRNEPWRGGRKEAVIFHAEMALMYHRRGQLVAIERFEIINGKRCFLDLIVKELKENETPEIIVEVKNWSGWPRWSVRTQLKRQINLERQILKYVASGRFVRVEFKGFIPDKVRSSPIFKQLMEQNKIELVAVSN